MKKTRTKYDREYKDSVLIAWHASGKSYSVFAKENDIPPMTFRSWIKKEMNSKSKSGFVKMPIPKDIASLYPKSIPAFSFKNLVIEKGDIKIYVPLNVDSESLQTILNTVRNME